MEQINYIAKIVNARGEITGYVEEGNLNSEWTSGTCVHKAYGHRNPKKGWFRIEYKNGRQFNTCNLVRETGTKTLKIEQS